MLDVEMGDEWRQSITGLGQSLMEAAGISKNIAELQQSLSEDFTRNASTHALIESALAQSSYIENLLSQNEAVREMRSTVDVLTGRQELFEIAEATKSSLAKMAEDSHLTEMLSSIAQSSLQDTIPNHIQKMLSPMELESRVPEESYRLPSEIFYVPPPSDFERTEEIKRSNQLQEEILQELRKLNENLQKGISEKNVKQTFEPGQPGRPRNLDDDWAFEQVRELGKDKNKIYQEWLERIGERAQLLANPRDSFNKAISMKRGKRD